MGCEDLSETRSGLNVLGSVRKQKRSSPADCAASVKVNRSAAMILNMEFFPRSAARVVDSRPPPPITPPEPASRDYAGWLYNSRVLGASRPRRAGVPKRLVQAG